ncbi:TetR/AcrR family transcriptional regulator [Nocardioides caldifontis]|uniref:TetR/AcrR family transcriptional regulator n=1 Tax=Nocardioides caldifontis TaxID=2588938 RepID=UPI0011E046C3|nr:TetR/AcrR family transcriptional regulator [Nocardioides caldifontis]
MPVQVRRQEERSAATRRALLDATVTCLAELGYVGTTSAAVAERAGLSRGAQLHHFGTRDQLLVAAVEHLAQKRLRRVRDQMSRLGRSDGRQEKSSTTQNPETALRLLAEALSNPLYAASLELWVAARSHRALRTELVPAEDRVNAELAEICRTYVTDDSIEIRLTLDLLLGRGVSGLLAPHSSRHQAEALNAWARRLRGAPRG